MSDDQAHPGPAVGEWKNREVPAGAVLGVQRCGGLVGEPGVEFFARPGRWDELDVRRVAAHHPAVAAEWQRRSFDATRQPSPLKMVVEAPQTVDVDRPVIHPYALNHAAGSGCPLAQEQCLVGQIKNVRHFLSSLHFRHLLPMHTPPRSLEFAWWASSSIQSAVI